MPTRRANQPPLLKCLGTSLIQQIVAAAIALAGAEKGNLQLFDRDTGTLVIAAQQGFEEPFLTFFAEVWDDASAGAAAMRSNTQGIVEDVTTSEIFVGQPSQKVMIEAGARAGNPKGSRAQNRSGDCRGCTCTNLIWNTVRRRDPICRRPAMTVCCWSHRLRVQSGTSWNGMISDSTACSRQSIVGSVRYDKPIHTIVTGSQIDTAQGIFGCLARRNVDCECKKRLLIRRPPANR